MGGFGSRKAEGSSYLKQIYWGGRSRVVATQGWGPFVMGEEEHTSSAREHWHRLIGWESTNKEQSKKKKWYDEEVC
jgi:hypothetical protein